MIPFSYSARNLIVRKGTTLATAGGLAVVVFIFASVSMLTHSIDRTMARNANRDVAIVLRKGSEGELASNIAQRDAALVVSRPEVATEPDGSGAGVAELVGVVQVSRVGAKGAGNVQVRGVPDNALAFRPEAHIVAGRAPRAGTDEALVGEAIQGRFAGLRLGGDLSLRKNRPVHIVGVFAAGGSASDSEVWVGLNTAQAAFGREGLVSSVRVRLQSGSFDRFRAAVDGDRQLSATVLRESEYYQKQSQATSMLIGTLGTLVSLFFSVGAVLAAMITMQASVANRRRELGTLRALGFSKFQVIIAVLFEGLTLALLGGAVGAVCAMGLSAVKLSLLNSTTWSEMIFSFELTPGIVVSSIALAATMGLLGALMPALQAARVTPIDAMRA